MSFRNTMTRFAAFALACTAVLGSASGATTPAERLAAALQYPTVSHQTADLDETAFLGLHRYLEQSFPQTHATLKREVIAGYSLLYTWPGRDGSLAPMLLTSHLDVVPVSEASRGSWEHPPFAGAIADGYVWGRGAVDDKVGVLATLEAVEALVVAGFEPERTVYLAFGHDEEVGGPAGAGAITRTLAERGVRLWFSLDEGMLIVEDGLFGVAGPIALIGIAEKGSLSLRLTARAKGGHSSMPPPTGAIGRLARAITALESNPMPLRMGGVWEETVRALSPHLPFRTRLFLTTPPFSWMARGRLSADPAANAVVRTTTAVTMAGAGTKVNILPREAWAVVNFRVVPGDDTGAVVERVRDIIDDPEIEIEVMSASEPSASASARSEAYQLLAGAIAEIAPAAPVIPALVVGGTDSKHYGQIADDAYRFTPIRLRTEDRSRIHGVNERISLDSYREAIRFYETLIESAASAP